MSYKLILLYLFGLLALAAAVPWPFQKVSDKTELGDTSDEQTEVQLQEESDEKDKSFYVHDVLGTTSCRYLKNEGYLAKDANLRKLCLKTYNCKDILSKQSCKDVLARKECLRDSRLSSMYCAFTCNRCGLPQLAHKCLKSVPLGMQSKAIPDSEITASSIFDNNHKANLARLHMNSHWAPKVNKIGEWIEVDLSQVTTITGIATQGRKTKDFQQWVKSYSLEFSLDGRTFLKYQKGKIFAANVDRDSVVKHDLNPPIQARYIRVYPKTWNGHISMRMELYGCK